MSLTRHPGAIEDALKRRLAALLNMTEANGCTADLAKSEGGPVGDLISDFRALSPEDRVLRHRRPGWTCGGNQSNTFGEA